MSGVSKKQIERARECDLLAYLEAREPNELVRLGGGAYCLREHDSLKISNGKWFWWSRGFGGRSALDFLVKVRGIPFTDAVHQICGNAAYIVAPAPYARQKNDTEPIKKEFALPEKNINNDRVKRYLTQKRGLPQKLVEWCIANDTLYEDIRHNCVFVGKDEQGEPRFAALRGSYDKEGGSFRGDVGGSDKRYSFAVTTPGNRRVCAFESAIDLLSYMTLYDTSGADLISLSGVYKRSAETGMKIPAALTHYIETHSELETVCLCFDSDDVGRAAATDMAAALQSAGLPDVRISKLSGSCKDFNDVLKAEVGIGPKGEVEHGGAR